MKKKHFFSAVALAAVFAGCSQDELISESNFQEADNRPTVEAPVITLGADTRMTTEGSYAKVEWEQGDGFGAMLMDTYVPGKTKWAELFPIQDYVSSNVLYKTEDGKAFTAEASLKQGNYLFYAPFNAENFKREPLAVKLPLVQNVVPSTTEAPSNTAITEFYKAKTYPVFVAYDSIWNTPKTNLALNMKHIYALPKITLKLGKVQLLDENGDLKVDSKTKKAIYETSIKVDSIKFTNANKKIVTAGTIKNKDIVAKIGKDKDGNVAWNKAKWENAATADIVKADAKGADGEVVVKFSPALTISATKGGEFFMVLPGAEYKQADLAVEVYTTIDGKAYVSAASSLASEVATIKPFKDMRLLPGLPYSADEYNADGTMKNTKGTSATYTVAGGFIPAETAISGYTEIKNYAELVNFIKNVAYRGEPLIEMTKTEAEAIVAKGMTPDPKKYFVITVEDEKTPIELDDNFVTEFKNACVIVNGDASIAFKPNNKQVTLGDITYSTDEPIKFNAGELTYNNDEIDYTEATIDHSKLAYVTGNVVLKGKANPAFGALEVQKDASVKLSADLKVVATSLVRVNNNGGTITSETEAYIRIWNNIGKAVINKTPNASSILTNGPVSDPVADDNVDYYATMDINADVASVERNRAMGQVNVTGASVTFNTNDGLVVAGDNVANITITAGTGSVDNTENGKITNTATQTVFATVAGSTGADGFKQYDALSGLTKVVLTGAWKVNDGDANTAVAALFGANKALENVTKIDFNAGSSLYVGSDDGAELTLDLSKVTTININADVKWSGRAKSVSKVKLSGAEAGVITVADKDDKGNKYTFTKEDIAITNN